MFFPPFIWVWIDGQDVRPPLQTMIDMDVNHYFAPDSFVVLRAPTIALLGPFRVLELV